MEIAKLIRPHLKGIQAYSSARDEFSGDASVFLDANENALGSIAKGDYNRYPDPHHTRLRSSWSALKTVPEDQIFFGNGSDEPIDLLMRLFCEPGHDNIVIMPPTYGMYTVSAAINNVSINEAPLNAQFEIEMDILRATWNNESKICFICSPNNPSGNLLNTNVVENIINEFEGIVVIDEAYVDFTGNYSWSSRLAEFPNLVVLQTMSKAWGMAAVRVGVAMASPLIISMLEKIKPPYNISLPNQRLALEALANHKLQTEYIQELIKERTFIFEELQQSEHVHWVFPSNANFLLVKFFAASEMYDFLSSKGVIVRDRSTQLHCENCLRVTIGTPDENQKLLKLIAEFKP